MESHDGYFIRRTFGYLWAMAIGAQVVNISYFEQVPPFRSFGKHQVIGDIDSQEWMAPQRAQKAEPGSFLKDYTLILCGEFDILPRRNSDTSQIYSKDRILLLSRLCGASVFSMQELANEEYASDCAKINSDTAGKVAILVKPKPHSRDWRAAKKIVVDHPTIQKAHPIVCTNWLLDSIGDWRHKDFDSYTQANFNKK